MKVQNMKKEKWVDFRLEDGEVYKRVILSDLKNHKFQFEGHFQVIFEDDTVLIKAIEKEPQNKNPS